MKNTAEHFLGLFAETNNYGLEVGEQATLYNTQYITALRSKDVIGYRVKTITSGNQREVLVYPIWETHPFNTREKRQKMSSNRK